ncbi:peptidoglycan-binding protein [bacterium]|nr:peptidoglycan-binding protein [bacterium]
MDLVKNSRALTLFVMSLVISASFAFAPLLVEADTLSIDFESYATGAINGQNGWTKTGSYDVEVVESSVLSGSKSLRFSNAVTSGSFGDQTFTTSLTDEAGDAQAVSGGQSGGARQNHFEAEFKIKAATTTYQPGLFLSVSPDRGDGARMSYLSFADTAEGIDVNFYDVQSVIDPAVFTPTLVANDLSRESAHTAKFVIDFVDGPSNDIVKIYIDGNLVHTGTTWENYFRFDNESNPSLADESRTVDSLLFRAGGTAAPATLGVGFLIDDITLTSSTATPVNSSDTVKISGNTSAAENALGWMFNRDTSTASPFAFNTGAASIGTGSLFVSPISSTTASNKFIGELFLLKKISEIGSISYDFKIAAPSADVEEQFYMNVYANFGVSSSTKFYDCRYNVVPTTGSTGAFTTVTFDPTQSYPVTTRTGGQASPFTCPSSPAGMNALSAGSSIRVVAINVGDTSLGDAGVSGYLDNVKVVTKSGINTDTTIYDLEPKNVTPTANDMTVLVPVNGWADFTLDYSDEDDFSGEAFVFTVNNPQDGELSGTAPLLTYTPDEDFFGSDSFTFWVNDGSSTSNIATVNLITYESPDCPEGMNFVGGGVDKCMNISIFVGIAGFPSNIADLIDELLEQYSSLEGLLAFLGTFDEFVSVDVEFITPTCSSGIFVGAHDVCENDGNNEEETPTDVCPNIDGDQSEVLSGKVIQDGQCVDQTTGGGSSTPAPTSGGGGSRGGGGGGGGPAIPQVLGAATGTCYQFTRNLSFGMRGDDVLELQKALAAKGHMTAAANGNFGPATQAAVISFQKANGLEQVGMAGPKTRALLNVCPGGVNPNQALIDELTKKLNVILAQIQQLLAARTQ